jgi:hypothetical protein
VDHLQGVELPQGSQAPDGVDELRGREAELRLVAPRRLPLPGALGVQLEADAHDGLDAHLGRHPQDALELARLLERDHHVLAELPAPEGEPDEVVVLEAVAADQRVRVGVLDQDERQLGLAAGLEAGGVTGAVLGDRLDDHAALVHLDRVHALVARLVARLPDRRVERLVDAVEPVLDDLREAQDHGQRASLGLQPLDDGWDRDAGAGALRIVTCMSPSAPTSK